MDTLDDLIRDPRRLAALRRLALLDTPPEAAYDRLTELARKILNAPTSLVTLIDEDRQFFKSAFGVGEPWASRRGTPLSYSFCKHSIPTGEPLIIEDARLHPLVQDSPAITELDVIAYAGIPLITSDGQVVGSLCVLDTQPRQWTDEEIGVLKELASIVMTEIALRIELKERIRMQEALRETEDRYRALFDRSQDAVFIHDFEGHFIDANDAALQLLDYTREDISSLNFLSLLTTPDQVPLASAVIEEIKARGFQETVSEFRWKTRTGDEVIVGTLASVIEHNGSAQAIQGIARDITLHKQAEEAFHKNYEKEKELANLRSRFMAMVSHDFRTPLAVIQSSSELLKQYGDRMTAEKRDSHLETIRNQIKRQLELLDDLMAINQAEALGVSFKPGWMNWETFCRDMIHELQFTTGVNHLLEFFSSGTSMEAWIDEKLMRRALSNLLSNAIKYSPASSTVRVELFCDAAKTLIRIQDAGVGIPEKDLPHLFEPFFRASNTRSIQGTGLGLVIVKQVIEAHGGTIEVESKVNSGTSFIITIPKLARPVE